MCISDRWARDPRQIILAERVKPGDFCRSEPLLSNVVAPNWCQNWSDASVYDPTDGSRLPRLARDVIWENGRFQIESSMSVGRSR